MSLKLKSAESCKFDLVALGESMIRLSPPGHGRIEFAPALEVWVGGGEYNVAYALSRLGLRTGWVGGLNTSPMGRIIANHARAVGMDISHAVTKKYDGVGKVDRIGLNFTEVGHSKRASVTLYDRGHTATSGMQPGDVNWKQLFAEQGVRWLPHGRHLRRALGRYPQSRRRSGESGPRSRHDRQLRPQLPLEALVLEGSHRNH
jgi:2-dehydro-3-deoxygluconokinase